MRGRRHGHRDDRRGRLNGPPESVRITATALAAIHGHAQRESPNECCGLLVGTRDSIDEAVPTRNLSADPSRYRIDPQDHIDANRRLRDTSRAVIGAYHSHPHSLAVPSTRDLAEAYYPEFVWLIVSLEREDPDYRAYRIKEGAAIALTLIVDA